MYEQMEYLECWQGCPIKNGFSLITVAEFYHRTDPFSQKWEKVPEGRMRVLSSGTIFAPSSASSRGLH